MAGVGGPTEQDSVVLRTSVGQDLKDPGEHARLWATAMESLVEERELF